MKKIFILLALLQGAFCVGNAKTVDLNTAKNVGYTFLSQKGSEVAGISDLQMVYEATTQVNGAAVPCFYVFNVSSSKGFVIVSGDDNVTPVLGYSAHTMFQAQNMRSNVAGWLANYQKQISYVINKNTPATKAITEKWTSLVSGNMLTAAKTTSVPEMLTTQWDQEPYYNAFCPYDNSSQLYTVTGCVATAMAQVMNFWAYPKVGSGKHTYVDPVYGTQTADFGTTAYAWSSMPATTNALTSSNYTGVATLMYHVGVSVDMTYGTDQTDGSGSYVTTMSSPVINCTEYALKTYFNYRPTLQGLSRTDAYGNDIYTETQWTNLLETELNAARPVIYTGAGQAGGHCWVCDGYDNTGMFHFNWGWSSQSDGYYTVDNLAPPALGVGGAGGDFDADQTIVIGIQPPAAAAANSNVIKMNAHIDNSVSMPAKFGAAFSLSTKFKNTGTSSFSGDFCAIVYGSDNSFVDTLKTVYAQTLAASGSTAALTFGTTGLYNMVSGLYHINFYSRPTGGTWSLIADGSLSTTPYINYASMSVDNQGSIFLLEQTEVQQNGVNTTTLTRNKPVTVKGLVGNFYASSNFTGDIDASLYSTTTGAKVFTIKQLTGQTVSTQNYNGLSLSFVGGNLTAPSGTYVLEITDEATGLSAFETTGSMYYPNPILVTVVDAVGIEETTLNSVVKIYPNPASDHITVDMEGVNVTSIRIMDIAGRQVTNTIAAQNQSSVSIPVSNMTPGMYFVQLNTADGVITRKIVVGK